MKVLNFGSMNVDYVYQVDHILIPGETLASSERNVFCGGKGLNQSIALAKAGIPVYHAGLVGEGGDALLDTCRENGVNTQFVKRVEGPCGHTMIQVDKNGQNSILLFGGSNRCMTKAFVDEVLENFDKGDMLLLQNEINELSYIIDSAYEKGMMIILNPSPYDSALEECDLTKVSLFLVNEIEGEQITGEQEPEKILEKMKEKYPHSSVVLTLGSLCIPGRYRNLSSGNLQGKGSGYNGSRRYVYRIFYFFHYRWKTGAGGTCPGGKGIVYRRFKTRSCLLDSSEK